ncbi:class II glutamine amidotransferase [Corallococcus sp. H22C18031201]|uniref:class II glutamine amidotransferase n=1 Tax=Citreicoccus inhibens TaxID=2849499 RepID=UPI000E75A2E1|nr:class II glutamine amidotransferase [Citreicoccus inhibens]MBU8896997.1 class II glutamine amidotransferase [Citreicoccus inhibens]RJS19627.1 class II glutamine amidotransferase [Corallococcus sp. H22C18031201]
MCRLFGIRSAVPAAVHSALVTEKNSLLRQSREHKDGWGIAAYGPEPLPHVEHGVGAAFNDPDFERVSSGVSARTVVAHIRLASVGTVQLSNSHPFSFERWSFVHNGTLREFAQHQSAIEAHIRADLLAQIKGTTDSERCFYLFLTRLSQRVSLGGSVGLDQVAGALAETMSLVASITDVPGNEPKCRSAMNFLVTNGEVMVATRRNRTLFMSAGPRSCFGSGQAPAPGAALEQFIVSSESLCGGPHWLPLEEEDVVGVDQGLVFRKWKVQELAVRPATQHS